VSIQEGLLVWRDDPIEGETGILADVEALVDAGLWAET
jgi:hypothetical protein